MDQERNSAWEHVERVVMGVQLETVPRKDRSILSEWMAGPNRPSLQTAKTSFDWLARNNPVRLTINLKASQNGAVVPVPAIIANNPDAGLEAAHLHILWEHFFQNGGYERLKTCRICGDWFVNFGRNKRKIYCSSKCADHRWTRSARREAERDRKLKEIERKIADRKASAGSRRRVWKG